MYAAGSYTDHVTRYNRKPNRWMPDAPVKQPRTFEIASALICAVCVATAITLAVMLMQ